MTINIDPRKILSPHGQSLDTCHWVVKNYENDSRYHSDPGIREWVDASQLLIDQERLGY